MIDVEPLIDGSFARLYPVPTVSVDWEDVLARTGARHRHPVRRRLVVAFALAAAIGGVLLAGSFRGNGPDVLERAQAALNPRDRILHVASRWVDDRVTFDEFWALPDGSLTHVVLRSGSGELGADCVDSVAASRCWNPEANVVDVYPHPSPEPVTDQGPAVQYGSDWPGSLRGALASGNARVLGDASFCGKPVVAVLLAVPGRSGPPEYEQGVSHTLYLDRRTYLPVAEREPEGGTRYFDTFEFLPDTPENRKAVQLPAPADARVVVHPTGASPPEEKKDAGRGLLGLQCTPPG